jgi:hypothetical protein
MDGEKDNICRIALGGKLLGKAAANNLKIIGATLFHQIGSGAFGI